MLNGHRMNCPKCETKLTELSISYLEFVDLDIPQREELRAQCDDATQLKDISTTYRMYKYSKWYKKLQHEQKLSAAQSEAVQPVEDFKQFKDSDGDNITNEKTG